MALSPGTRLGPYEVTTLLGAGGMGEVYRGRDTRLKRDVALKVLPPALASDPERVARFQREAELLATLNHPHIATIHGVEEFDTDREAGSYKRLALVMELVGGETLADRIARGPLPSADALPIARQIADALAAAHDRGVVHRDLKPANIKVREDGTVKVLDFGLAKLAEPMAVNVSEALHASLSPTITSPALVTNAGMLLGTAAYMSPEQARGQVTDRRSDIWSFGCVLYEMLTGRQPFGGSTIPDVLGAILTTEPDWNRLPAVTPSHIRRLLKRCLSKDRKDRLHDIADARLEIDDAGAERELPEKRRSGRAAWFVAVAASTIALVLAYVAYHREPSMQPPQTVVPLTLPRGSGASTYAVSPDGRKVAFITTANGRPVMAWYSLQSGDTHVLSGTEGATGRLFWWPDSQNIGFMADGEFRRINAASGEQQRLGVKATVGAGAVNRAGVVVYGDIQSPIIRITNDGPVGVTTLDPLQQSHINPEFLPDDRHFLFYAPGPPAVRGIYVGSLDSPQIRRLFDATSPAIAFVPPDRILFILEGTLLSRRHDMRTLQPMSDAVPVARRVASVSAGDGIVAYRQSPPPSRYAWFSRNGEPAGAIDVPSQAQSIELSPDGKWLAYTRGREGNFDIWLYELGRGSSPRVTTDPRLDGSLLWSPKGDMIAYYRQDVGVMVQPFPLADEERALWKDGKDPTNKNLQDWSPDGTSMIARMSDDLYLIPVNGDSPVNLTNTPEVTERDARFSPDGHWVAFASNETGRFEVYLRPLAGGEKMPVSVGGGIQVRWPRQSGGEMLYLALDGTMMAVRVTFASRPAVGKPERLFATDILGRGNLDTLRSQYDVSADGQRFLMSTPIDQPPLTLVLNPKTPGN